MISLALIVPVFRFEKEILETLEKIRKWKDRHSQHRIRVILSDDGSKDQTVVRIQKWLQERDSDWSLLQQKENHGKGFVVRQGFQAALLENVDFLVFTDCDLFYGLDVIFERVVPELQFHDIVILDRSWRRNLVPVSLIRYWASEVFARLLAILTGVSFRDTQAGLKGFKASSCRPLFEVLTLNGFAFDVEILSVALYFRYRVKQVPVRFAVQANPTRSSVSLIRSSSQMFLDLVRINWNWRQKKYHTINLVGRIEYEIYTIHDEE